MTDGSLDFDDFLRQSKMMERAGSVASGAAKFGASLPGQFNVLRFYALYKEEVSRGACD